MGILVVSGGVSQTSLPGGMPPASRDLTGRIGASPELRWPNGAGLAVVRQEPGLLRAAADPRRPAAAIAI